VLERVSESCPRLQILSFNTELQTVLTIDYLRSTESQYLKTPLFSKSYPKRIGEVDNDVEEVERKPAEAVDEGDGGQHAVGATSL
jgi:hypothetical protein